MFEMINIGCDTPIIVRAINQKHFPLSLYDLLWEGVAISSNQFGSLLRIWVTLVGHC